MALSANNIEGATRATQLGMLSDGFYELYLPGAWGEDAPCRTDVDLDAVIAAGMASPGNDALPSVVPGAVRVLISRTLPRAMYPCRL